MVYSATPAGNRVIIETNGDDLECLLEQVASEANHETNRRRQKLLDVAVDALERQLDQIDPASKSALSTSTGVSAVIPINSKRPRPAKEGLKGKWRIFEMDLWDQDAIDLVGPGYIEFGKGRAGDLGFIAVQGGLDCRSTRTDDKESVEFTWHGFDEGDEVSGRGWAVLEDDGTISGRIYMHMGDDSGFRARRW